MALTEPELHAMLARGGARILGEPQLPADTSEAHLLARVRRLALDNGFLFYHTHDSRRSDLGYLDCTLTKPGHPLYIWELKTASGKLTHAQETWLAFLRQSTSIAAACYKPQDWETIQTLLTRRVP